MTDNTITRDHLAKTIKQATGLHHSKATNIIEQIVNNISDAIATHEEVKIRSFGSFITKEKKERIGRNPQTMKEVVIGERKVVKFKISPTLKKRINDTMQLIG